MELRHTKIPVRFLERLPDGLKYLHRNGKEYLVVERLTCPNGHSLMATSVHIHDEPSIRFKVRTGGQEGGTGDEQDDSPYQGEATPMAAPSPLT